MPMATDKAKTAATTTDGDKRAARPAPAKGTPAHTLRVMSRMTTILGELTPAAQKQVLAFLNSAVAEAADPKPQVT